MFVLGKFWVMLHIRQISLRGTCNGFEGNGPSGNCAF